MKKAIILFSAVAALATACNNAPEGASATTSEAQAAAAGTGVTYAIDTNASVVEWLGSKPVGQHNGTLKISEGQFSIAEGTITAGKFIIDINSLTDLDMEGEMKGKLEGHLKSPDFFDAEKFPTATFEVTKVEALTGDSTATHQISGNLTLKDSTKNVSFPANVTVADDAVKATANFNIDRTQWGMFYGSDQSLGDKMIRPEVNIKLNISANKL
ncbi:MAG TPA: YceI family protein [Flavihumibacter sp.]